MRRHASVILLIVALGAALNILLTIGLASFVSVYNNIPDRNSGQDGSVNWTIERWHGFGAASIASIRQESAPVDALVSAPVELIPGWSDLRRPTARFLQPDVTIEFRWIDLRGWPMYSFWCEMQRGYSGENGASSLSQGPLGAIELPLKPWTPAVGWLRIPRLLPLRPVWRGIIFNTAFYALLLWLLFVAPWKLRRSIRLRGRRCPLCGYPSGKSRVCTECGRELPQAARSPGAAT